MVHFPEEGNDEHQRHQRVTWRELSGSHPVRRVVPVEPPMGWSVAHRV